MTTTWTPADLRGTVTHVTGASHGVGKGIAPGLGEAGATVYLSGRTDDPDVRIYGLGSTIQQTAAEVEALGGVAIPVRRDHTDDDAVAALAADADILERSGTVQVAAALGLEFAFPDLDGRQPRPLTLEEA